MGWRCAARLFKLQREARARLAAPALRIGGATASIATTMAVTGGFAPTLPPRKLELRRAELQKTQPLKPVVEAELSKGKLAALKRLKAILYSEPSSAKMLKLDECPPALRGQYFDSIWSQWASFSESSLAGAVRAWKRYTAFMASLPPPPPFCQERPAP